MHLVRCLQHLCLTCACRVCRKVWASGDRYDGNWENGKMSGHGVKTMANGDVYTGVSRAAMHTAAQDRHAVVRLDGDGMC